MKGKSMSGIQEPKETLDPYLEPTEYLNSDHPAVTAKVRELTAGCADEREKLGQIYRYSRDMPYDILNSFKYLAEGKRQASDVIEAGHAFCMGKASVFVSLCRAAGIPARIAFHQLHCPEKTFMSDEVKAVWGDRILPWHSLGEAYLDGRWLILDATIPASVAEEKGRPYASDYDGETDIYSVEGPLVKDLGHFPDYPDEVSAWYEDMAKDVVRSLERSEVKEEMAGDDAFWTGPEAERL